jgi:hypothetical protein
MSSSVSWLFLNVRRNAQQRQLTVSTMALSAESPSTSSGRVRRWRVTTHSTPVRTFCVAICADTCPKISTNATACCASSPVIRVHLPTSIRSSTQPSLLTKNFDFRLSECLTLLVAFESPLRLPEPVFLALILRLSEHNLGSRAALRALSTPGQQRPSFKPSFHRGN